MSKNIQDPWRCYGSVVLIPNGGFDVGGCPDPEALASRIVACVNACAGISTEILEATEPGGIQKIISDKIKGAP